MILNCSLFPSFLSFSLSFIFSLSLFPVSLPIICPLHFFSSLSLSFHLLLLSLKKLFHPAIIFFLFPSLSPSHLSFPLSLSLFSSLPLCLFSRNLPYTFVNNIIIQNYLLLCRLTCPAGHYCTEGTKTQYQHPCPAGKYSRELGLEREDQCIQCNIGYYCPKGDGYGDRLCPAGYFCGHGVGDYKVHPCPAGKFQEEQGSRCK